MRITLVSFLGLVLVLAVGFFSFAPAKIESMRNRVEPADLPSVTAETQRLHDSLAIVDMHADTLMWDRDILDRSGRGHLDLPRLEDGNVALQVFSSVSKSPKGQNYDSNPTDAGDNITLLTIAQAPAASHLALPAGALALPRREARERGEGLRREAAADPLRGRPRRPPHRPQGRPARHRCALLGRGAAEPRGRLRQPRPALRRRDADGRLHPLLRQRGRGLDARREEGRADRPRPPRLHRDGAARHRRRHRPRQPPRRRRHARPGDQAARPLPRRRAGHLRRQPQPHRRGDPRRRRHRRGRRRRLLGRGRVRPHHQGRRRRDRPRGAGGRPPGRRARQRLRRRDHHRLGHHGGSLRSPRRLRDRGYDDAEVAAIMGGNTIRVLRAVLPR
ncbi:hypothetical protein [Nocardioides convexus]|uniref:hypothetical protein n=1 Tax=Nocardioides convexus TaxID=2712224 RepID=UPI0024184B07|nr:hypothetical protein [Nocardioides convexus]